MDGTAEATVRAKLETLYNLSGGDFAALMEDALTNGITVRFVNSTNELIPGAVYGTGSSKFVAIDLTPTDAFVNNCVWCNSFRNGNGIRDHGLGSADGVNGVYLGVGAGHFSASSTDWKGTRVMVEENLDRMD
jgi:hypothetical protein